MPCEGMYLRSILAARRSGVGNIGAVLFDKNIWLTYNILNKAAGR